MSATKMISRRKFLTLAGMVGLSGVASACGGSNTPTPTPNDKATTKESAPKPTSLPTPPPIVQLNYMFPGYAAACPDIALVEDALSKVTTERINAKIKLNLLEWDNYAQKLTLMSAASEQYDFCFTNNWVNPFYKNVENGQFVALDDLLPKYAPQYWKSMPATIWSAAKVKGKQYGAIHQQLFPRIHGFFASKTYVNKYKLDLDAVRQWIDIEPWLEAITKTDGFAPWPTFPWLYSSEAHSAAPVDDGIGWTQVSINDKLAKVTNVITSEPYSATWALEKRWYQRGYIVKEDPKGDEPRRMWSAGKAAIYAWFIKPGGEFELQSMVQGNEIVLKAMSPAILSTSSIILGMTGISRTTNSRETSTRWLELINTDEPTLNLLCLGIEGLHWNWKSRDKRVIEQTKDLRWNPSPDYMFGNQFNVYYRDEKQVGAWDESRKINDSATVSPLLGFVMDRESLKTELAAIDTTLAEWTPYGPKGKPATELPKLVDAMNSAGAKKVITEMQRQIDAWLATK